MEKRLRKVDKKLNKNLIFIFKKCKKNENGKKNEKMSGKVWKKVEKSWQKIEKNQRQKVKKIGKKSWKKS